MPHNKMGEFGLDRDRFESLHQRAQMKIAERTARAQRADPGDARGEVVFFNGIAAFLAFLANAENRTGAIAVPSSEDE